MLVTTLLAASSVGAPALVETRITAASLFKNGYAVLAREAPLPESGVALIERPPVASLGTLWVTASPGVTIQSVVATTVKTETTTDIGSLDALIAANTGKRVELRLTRPDNASVAIHTGRMISSAGSLVVIEDDNGGRRAFPKSRVYEIASESGDLVYQSKGESTKNVLRVTARGRGSVMTISLERGLTWVPGYHVDISDAKRLRLTSKATLMNDGAKLDSVDVKLITGFPHVRYINIFDPLTSAQSVDEFLMSMMATANAAEDSALARQSVFAGTRPGTFERAADPFSPFNPQQLTGLQLEDLFFYALSGVTLDTRERGYYVLFQEQADYTHVYTLDVPETGWWQNANEAYREPQETVYDVWHTLEFTNPTAFPFTTAAATTFKNGQVIGQDMLRYTAPKGEATLRITKALDVTNDLVEEETDRQIRALPSTNRSIAYDLVTAKGTIQVANYKADAVALKVTKRLVGEVTTVSHGGTVVKNRVGLRSLNPNSTVSWTVPLKAGEKVELTYGFKLYVPSP